MRWLSSEKPLAKQFRSFHHHVNKLISKPVFLWCHPLSDNFTNTRKNRVSCGVVCGVLLITCSFTCKEENMKSKLCNNDHFHVFGHYLPPFLHFVTRLTNQNYGLSWQDGVGRFSICNLHASTGSFLTCWLLKATLKTTYKVCTCFQTTAREGSGLEEEISI